MCSASRLSLLILGFNALAALPATAQSSLLEVLRANKDPLSSSSALPFNLTTLVDTILPTLPAITAILSDASTPKVFIAPSNAAIRQFLALNPTTALTETILRYHIIPATISVDPAITAQPSRRAFFSTSLGPMIGFSTPVAGSAIGSLYTVISGLTSQANIPASLPSSAVGTILLSDTVFVPPRPIAQMISTSSSIAAWASSIPPDLIPAITASPKNSVVFAVTNDAMARIAPTLGLLPSHIRDAVWYQHAAINFSPDPFVSTFPLPGTVLQFTPLKFQSLVAVNVSNTQSWTVRGQNATYPAATVSKPDAFLTSDGGVVHFVDNFLMPRWDLIPSPSPSPVPTSTASRATLPTLPTSSTPAPSLSSSPRRIAGPTPGSLILMSMLVCLLTSVALALLS